MPREKQAFLRPADNSLTEQETKILRELLRLNLATRVAEEMNVDYRFVLRNIHSMQDKLGCLTREELMVWALKNLT